MLFSPDINIIITISAKQNGGHVGLGTHSDVYQILLECLDAFSLRELIQLLPGLLQLQFEAVAILSQLQILKTIRIKVQPQTNSRLLLWP